MDLGIRLMGEWTPLLRPKKFGSYINDHTVFKDKAGGWRLLGVTARGSYAFFKESSFVEGTTDRLDREMEEVGLKFKANPYRGIKIAPMVYFDKPSDTYHLYFAGINIYHLSSRDGVNWENQALAVRSWWPWLRDPHVVKADKQYLLYVTDVGNKVSVFASDDLYHWKKAGVALQLGQGIPKSVNSACESPVVFKWNKWWILLTTITPATSSLITRRENYAHTVAFASADPLHFGVYADSRENTANLIGHLETHAPEVIDDSGRLDITTCGWLGFPKPQGVSEEGVYIRGLEIHEV